MKFFNRDRFMQLMAEWPLLRMLFFQFWFRLVFVVFLCLLFFLALFLPRIWRTSPSGFKPVIRVSGLDLVQAWSLKRTAIKAGAAGRDAESAYAWQAALHHNPADPSLMRGVLQQTIKMESSPRTLSMAMNQCNWLLRLTSTNLADVALSARVYERFRLPDMILRVLEPQADALPLELEVIYLKALFNQGLISQFADRWEKKKGVSIADPELPFYYAAYQAGWGPWATFMDGRRKLASAAETSPQRELVNRLLIAVSAHRRDLAGYAEALQRLQTWKADLISDHIGYWYLIAAQGQAKTAASLAQSYETPPTSAMETVRLAEALKNLGLRDQALQVLAKYVPQFDDMTIGWITYARFLIDAQKWEDLRSLALRIRQESAVRDLLTDYSYFLEGRAELGLGKRVIAEATFEKAAQFEFANAGLGLSATVDLIKLGYPQYARMILERLERASGSDPQYWTLAARTAYELKQPDWLLEAAAKAYQLNPTPILIRNYYAAALLIRREKPAEAIKLTLELFTQNPSIIGFRLNHCLALLLNQRPREAGDLLRPINPDNLNPEEANAYYQAMCEMYFQLGQYPEAQKFLNQIDRQRFFPNQLIWLESMQQQIGRSAK
jgi:predicted Zn-dependent protease